jgi:putative exporter of polyketide antibiotics
VVVVAVRDEAAIPEFLSKFGQTSQSSEISQSVSVLYGAQFSSYRVGSQMYWVGDLSWITRTQLMLEQFPWLIAMVSVILCFLIAGLLQARLRRRARLRLQTAE